MSNKNVSLTDRQKANRRVAIAEDVLKWLRTKKLTIKTQTYCRFNDEYDLYKFDGDDMQAVMGKIITPFKPCSVCAKGALFIAAVDKFNSVKVRAFGMNDEDVVMEPLLAYFTEEQLNLVEAAFEGWNHLAGDADLVEYVTEDYIKKYPDARKRLRAIMRNIIVNKGTFVLPLREALEGDE